jgi:hypothetical protein
MFCYRNGVGRQSLGTDGGTRLVHAVQSCQRTNADTYEYQDKLVIMNKSGGTMIEALAGHPFHVHSVKSGNSQPLRVEVCPKYSTP